MSDFRYDFSPTDSQLCHFYQHWGGVVWQIAVKIHFKDNKGKNVFTGTAFAVDSSGLLMTSAHTFHITDSEIDFPVVKARRLEDPDGHFFDAKVVKCKVAWDVALIEVANVKDCMCVKFANSGKLSLGQMLTHIGNPGEFLGSYLIGKVAYKCVDDPQIPSDEDKMSCDYFEPRGIAITPPYRIMGDVANRTHFVLLPDENKSIRDFGKDIDPRVPIVQMYNFGFQPGCSGGPIFNGEGYVVGMVRGGVTTPLGAHYDIGIHVSVLKDFLKHYKPKRKVVAVQIGDSKKPKMGPGNLK